MWADEAVPRLQALGLGSDGGRAGRTGWPGSANRRSPSCSARRCSGRPTRSSRRTPGPRRSTSGSRPSRPTTTSAEDARRSGGRGVARGTLGDYVWATGETTWSDAIGARLGELGWTLAVVEIGTGGSVAALFGDAPWLRFDESIAAEAPAATAHGSRADGPDGDDAPTRPTRQRPTTSSATRGGPASSAARTSASPSGPGRASGDTAVSIAVVDAVRRAPASGASSS